MRTCRHRRREIVFVMGIMKAYLAMERKGVLSFRSLAVRSFPGGAPAPPSVAICFVGDFADVFHATATRRFPAHSDHECRAGRCGSTQWRVAGLSSWMHAVLRRRVRHQSTGRFATAERPLGTGEDRL